MAEQHQVGCSIAWTGTWANPGTEPQNMSEAELTASIKKLAVKVESKLLHRIKMGQAKQAPETSVNNYLAQ